jgi:hypothetical protein
VQVHAVEELYQVELRNFVSSPEILVHSTQAVSILNETDFCLIFGLDGSPELPEFLRLARGEAFLGLSHVLCEAL